MKYQSLLCWQLALCITLTQAVAARAVEPTGDRRVVEQMPGLMAFWAFGEEAGHG